MNAFMDSIWAWLQASTWPSHQPWTLITIMLMGGVTIAVRDIQAGEEVTMNYDEFEEIPALPKALIPLVERRLAGLALQR